MGVYGCLRVFMGVSGCLWVFVGVRGCLWVIVRKRRIPVLLLLINRGAVINARDGDGKAALHLASSKDYLEIVLLLFDRGV